MKYLKVIAFSCFLTSVTSFSYGNSFTDSQKEFYKITSTKTTVVDIDPIEMNSMMSTGNLHLACQDDLASGIFDTTNSNILGPIKEEVKTAKEIVDETEKILDGLINIGEKIWNIVKAGQSVVNLNIGPSANALPRGIACWDELETWQKPKGLRIKNVFENAYGFNMVEFQFDVIFTYGGSLGGKGKYLTHVQVHPSDIYAFWGTELNASVEIPSLVNMGSTTDPIAGMQVDVKWQVKTFLNQVQQATSIFVTGDGDIKQLKTK